MMVNVAGHRLSEPVRSAVIEDRHAACPRAGRQSQDGGPLSVGDPNGLLDATCASSGRVVDDDRDVPDERIGRRTAHVQRPPGPRHAEDVQLRACLRGLARGYGPRRRRRGDRDGRDGRAQPLDRGAGAVLAFACSREDRFAVPGPLDETASRCSL
jgi:hypothetical protein